MQKAPVKQPAAPAPAIARPTMSIGLFTAVAQSKDPISKMAR